MRLVFSKPPHKPRWKWGRSTLCYTQGWHGSGGNMSPACGGVVRSWGGQQVAALAIWRQYIYKKPYTSQAVSIHTFSYLRKDRYSWFWQRVVLKLCLAKIFKNEFLINFSNQINRNCSPWLNPILYYASYLFDSLFYLTIN